MQESGGRRVKRSINIDMTSVHFCTPEMLAKYRKIQLLKDYVDETEKVVEEYNKEHHIDNSVLVNGRRQTNLIRMMKETNIHSQVTSTIAGDDGEAMAKSEGYVAENGFVATDPTHFGKTYHDKLL